jgi:excisionase family DNA binding protein
MWHSTIGAIERKGIPMAEHFKDSLCIDFGGQEASRQVMTSVEAAEYLKMHVKTVCRLAKEGKIPAKKVGSEWRFLRSVLDRWLAEELV